MTHDTTPVVGDVWEHSWGFRLRVVHVGREKMAYEFVGRREPARIVTIDEWNTLAANARRVG